MGKLIERPAESIPEHEVPPPPLQSGDRLTRDEFERRYEATPEGFKAELIEGVVHMPSTVSYNHHGKPHALLSAWLVHYVAETPGVDAGCDATVRLDGDNEPQPDACLRILPTHGGRCRTGPKDYLEGAPEFIAEVAASSASVDLNDKLNAYRRNGVREYVVLRTFDRALDWFVLRFDRYERLAADASGILCSATFPGLWLEPAALISGDAARVLEIARRGAESSEHAAFVAHLAEQAKSSPAR